MKDPGKAITLLSRKCEIQRKGGRKFVVSMSLQALRRVQAWKDMERKTEVKNLGFLKAEKMGCG